MSSPTQSTAGGFWQTPAIAGYGAVHPLPDAELQPSAARRYRVVFDLRKGADGPDAVNPGLDHVARAVNMFAAAEVPTEHLDFAVVIHGPATSLVMDEDAHRTKTGTGNPNGELIAALHAAGVKLYVCAQALAESDIDFQALQAGIRLTPSALSDLILLQDEGYVLVEQ